ncbi:MAG TPA: tRNA (N6-isopentenyl adenosine(37)-C2)-methylthiotransferase MiaB [Nitrospirota bacterium]|nr:tRNA (N6-isopentenyl adenosine(37)-C2)-methylthiotransferase MiaB [Nitrospirota bacterium]
MKSFHIITFGCQMNEHDSERMTGVLRDRGCAPVSGVADADMIILNTCSIREKAEQKFYSELGRLKQLKAERPGMKIAVAGCIAQQEGKNILTRAPYVDLIFGPSDVARLPVMVDEAFSRQSPVVDTCGDPEYHKKRIPTARVDKVKAWVSIMYGCDNFCTYCVVPYLRGRERSRPSADIVNEVQELARQGYKEVSLLGQNVNSYGKGLGEDTDFPALLRMVNEVPALERIRFVTSHPRDLSDGLIDAVRELPKVCESLHLPVQSGSDNILHAMNRRYTRADYLDKVKRLRDAVPEITLTTDIIVGFPGESAEDFEATIQLLEEVRYDGIFAFKYSKRPGTAALKLQEHLPEDIKEARLTKVLSLQKKITMQKNKAYAGMHAEVLIDGRSKRGGKLSGRTRGNKVVNVAGPDSLIGSLVAVRITAAGANSLSGEICG